MTRAGLSRTLGGLVWRSGFQCYDVLQSPPVFACGSSIVGTVGSSIVGTVSSFIRTTYSGKGWACDMIGVDQDNFVHGRWTRMVDVPHVGEWKYSFQYRGRATSIHCLFLMNAIVSTITTEECETRQPSELGMCTTPSFLMYHSIDYKVGYKVTTFSHFLFIYFLSNVFYLSFFRYNCFLCLSLALFFYT